jgi:hypothetical protein
MEPESFPFAVLLTPREGDFFFSIIIVLFCTYNNTSPETKLDCYYCNSLNPSITDTFKPKSL